MKSNSSGQVIVICGPTASGKSGLALELAKHINAEIVSADSMQIYRELDIGTAKVDLKMQDQVNHHMIDIINPDESFSVAEYSKKSTKIIQKLLSDKKNVILCGGTGQYINALLDGLIFIETPVSQSLREEINNNISKNNAHIWHLKLSNIDSSSGKRISVNDLRRIRRFFEIYESTGFTQTEIYQRSHDKGPDFSFINFYLKPDRNKLYQKINSRVEEMFSQGLIEEVRTLTERYPQIRQAQSFQAIGYKETAAYLAGKTDLSSAKNKIAQVTRNYSKRQFTWFNARSDLYLVEDFGNTKTLNVILGHLMQ